jgi:hypothetical protein
MWTTTAPEGERLVVEPPRFLHDAAETEGWNILDQRRRLILCRLLEWLGVTSLRFGSDPEGNRMLTAEAGTSAERHQVTVSHTDPKATLAALDLLVRRLEAAERTALASAG